MIFSLMARQRSEKQRDGKEGYSRDHMVVITFFDFFLKRENRENRYHLWQRRGFFMQNSGIPPVGSGLGGDQQIHQPAAQRPRTHRHHRRPRTTQQPSRSHHRPRVPQGVATAPDRIVPAEQQPSQAPQDRGPPGLFETGFWLGVSLVDKILRSIGFYAICRGVWHLLGNAINSFRGDFALRGEPSAQPVPAPPEDRLEGIDNPRQVLALLRGGLFGDIRIPMIFGRLVPREEQEQTYLELGRKECPLSFMERITLWSKDALEERHLIKGKELTFRKPERIAGRTLQALWSHYHPNQPLQL